MAQKLPRLLCLADLAEVVGVTPESLSMRLSRNPESFPPRWIPPGGRKKTRVARLWHPADVQDWLEAGRKARRK